MTKHNTIDEKNCGFIGQTDWGKWEKNFREELAPSPKRNLHKLKQKDPGGKRQYPGLGEMDPEKFISIEKPKIQDFQEESGSVPSNG